MLKITVYLKESAGSPLGIKELIAMDLEKYGKALITAVEETTPQQMRMDLSGNQ